MINKLGFVGVNGYGAIALMSKMNFPGSVLFGKETSLILISKLLQLLAETVIPAGIAGI